MSKEPEHGSQDSFSFKQLGTKKHSGFFTVSAGSYAQIFANATVALKKPFDAITQESVYYLFREGLYLKQGYGPSFLGPAVRYESHCGLKRLKFCGYLLERLEEPLSKYVPLKAEHLCLFGDAAQALAKLHEHGHVHCDIKPSNILVSKSFKALLTDFGLACYASDRGPSPCEGKAPIYTPAFRAPEHLLGSQRISEFSDVWALGMSMYVSALCPRYPGLEHIDTVKLMTIVKKHLDPVDSKRLENLRALCATRSMPQALADIINECLVWVPEKRAKASWIAEKLQVFTRGSKALPLKYGSFNEIEVLQLEITRPVSGLSSFQSERLELSLKNFCKLVSISVPEDILYISKEYCKILDYYRPNIHNPGLAALLAVYTIRESSLLNFVVCSKLLGTSLLHFTELLEESICFILGV